MPSVGIKLETFQLNRSRINTETKKTEVSCSYFSRINKLQGVKYYRFYFWLADRYDPQNVSSSFISQFYLLA